MTSPAPVPLMQRVGARVRAAREAAGLPRRVLSELSGVSMRYLAQIEAGDGNVSIARLERVAAALGLPVARLVEDGGADADRLAGLFARADAATRAEVLRLLKAGAGPARGGRIALVGLRGAGKSTLGRRAGAALGLPFVELNAEIEAQSGIAVGELIALYGQEGYRRLEAQALDRVIARHPRAVIAVAGGIVTDPETYARLLRRCHTIWLRASAAEHMERVRAQGDERPMADNPAAMEELRSILTSREALYGRAEAVLDTSGRDAETSLRDLLALIAEKGFLGAAEG